MKPTPKSNDFTISLKTEKVANWWGVRVIVALVRRLFIDLAPPTVGIRTFLLDRRTKWHVFLSGALVTFILCFVLPHLGTMMTGTYSGNARDVYYLSRDWHNLLIYLVVCPVYVGSGCVLMASVITGMAKLNELERDCEVPSSPPAKLIWKLAGLVFFMLAVALMLTANYIHDATQTFEIEEREQIYWFCSWTVGGAPRLNMVGYYYFILNFVLMMFTILSLVFYLTTASSVIKVARALYGRIGNADAPSDKLDAEKIRTKLKTFMDATLAAKTQVALYIINVWIWKDSPLGGSQNAIIATWVLALVSYAFLKLPQSFVELQWYKYKEHFRLKDEDLDLQSLYWDGETTYNWILDAFFLGGVSLPFISKFLPSI